MRMNMKKILIFVLMFWLCFSLTSRASDYQVETEDKIFSQFEFQRMDEFLEKVFPDDKLSFRDLVKGLISGEIELSPELSSVV